MTVPQKVGQASLEVPMCVISPVRLHIYIYIYIFPL